MRSSCRRICCRRRRSSRRRKRWPTAPRREVELDRYAIIALGSALGAVARYQVAAMIQARIPAGFPWGTFVVNVTGCVAMGIVMTLLSERLIVHPNWRFLIPIGFIGAYTTFSTVE